MSIIVETGEAHDVHQQALLIGYGADAINPYLALASIRTMMEKENLMKPLLMKSNTALFKSCQRMESSKLCPKWGFQRFKAIVVRKS